MYYMNLGTLSIKCPSTSDIKSSIYTCVAVLQVFMVHAASHIGADDSRAPGLSSGVQVGVTVTVCEHGTKRPCWSKKYYC